MAIASRKLERLQATAEKFNDKKTGEGKLVPIQCNIRNQDDVKNTVQVNHTEERQGMNSNLTNIFLLQKLLTDYEKIDLLVNNGGGQFLSSFQVSGNWK